MGKVLVNSDEYNGQCVAMVKELLRKMEFVEFLPT